MTDRKPDNRFIPASAGNRGLQSAAWLPMPVHPRERGEQDGTGHFDGHECGSSPRARGTVLLLLRESVHYRFIPASAGNSTASTLSARRSPVHPRERGEQ